MSANIRKLSLNDGIELQDAVISPKSPLFKRKPSFPKEMSTSVSEITEEEGEQDSLIPNHVLNATGGEKATWNSRVYFLRSLKEVFFGSSLNILLPFVPISIAAVKLKAPEAWIFLFSLLGIAPLAERLGFVTEQLAIFTGPTVGGLLNATFGNATELIISILALRARLLRVVQMSLLGSILSNMLLVLGTAFFFGGLKHKEQRFNKTAALVSSGLLLMSVMGLVLPAVLQATHTERKQESSELALSRVTSGTLLLAYAMFLYFQLFSHSHLYEEEAGEEGETKEEDEEEDILGFWGSLVWMGIITFFISVLSDFLVTAIEGAAASWDLPVAFISVIILPIVGNAAEHASAVVFAVKNKLDITLGVAIGSSTQIAMFVIPFCVMVAWGMGVNLDLNFRLYETATLVITIMVVTIVLQDGSSNYFKGVMLFLSYVIVAASFYVHQDQEEGEQWSSAALPPKSP